MVWAPRLAAIALALAVSTSAHAQPAEPVEPAPGEVEVPAPAPDAPDAPAPGAPPAAGQPADDEAYERGFEALRKGDFDAAIALLSQVVSAGGPRAPAAGALLRLARDYQRRGVHLRWDSPASAAAPPAAAASDAGPGADARADADDRTDGRTSFVISTTLASFYTGFVLVDLLDLDDRPAIVTVSGATAAGFAGSLLGSRGRRIGAGTASAYGSGLLIGLGNGLLLAGPLGVGGDSEPLLSTALGGMVIGGTAGMLAGRWADPTEGQASFATQTAVLGFASVGLGLAIMQPDVDDDTVQLALAGGLDVGAAVGIGMAPGIDWSISRARLVGLGTFLGALGGVTTAALLTGVDDPSSDEVRAWAGATLAGTWGGFALAAHLTRDMAADRRAGAPIAVTPTPLPEGLGLAVTGAF